ncbi:PREDICTED: LOW QUALITY PROTEIN: TRIO and F-actin-binding protein [Cercocebus atys]|uniref:LOW QUALITY PROTEIN: TRIO and F-actin-binding protein n=1 Tax=Cercocebus atys TaxID=9531 RepID=UPI0005F4D11B|nr:PREDICTED: LOW QUALITY PROTEIN: TRIO and F-actin-binding protein [Cercocebus atys]
MEEVPGDAPCEHFEANMLTQNRRQNCFHPEEAHGARYQELRSPSGAEVPYCDLPRCPPAPEDPLSASTSSCRSVVDPGLGPGSRRGPSPSAGLPEEGPTAAPRSGSHDLEAVPYLEGLTTSLRGSCNEDPGSDPGSSADSATPDDTSNSSSVDWDTVERQEEAPNWDELAVMIPRRPQEGPKADSSQKAPSLLTRSPVGGDTAGQKKEDTGGGGRSAGQHWAKLRGESGFFSLERHRSTLTQAASMTPHSGPRSTMPRASPAQRDTAQAASTRETPRASSPHRITQRDTSRASSTQQDTSRASFTQRNTPRASSPSRSTQQDNPRTSSNQQNNPQYPSPQRATQQNNPRTSSTQQDNPQTSFPTCTPQWDNPRTPCARWGDPRASSPNRATQRDNPRTSCAQRDDPRAFSPNTATRDNPRISCAQQDNPRTSSPNRTTQQDNPRTSCAQRDNPRAFSQIKATQQDNPRMSCAQRDNPRASSPNRTTRDNPRTSCAQRDNPRASSPNRTTRDNPRTSCAQWDNPRTSSPNRTTQRDNPRTSCAQRDNPRASSPNRTTPQDNPRASSPVRASQQDNPRTSCAQRDNPRASSPNRTTQQDNPRTSCAQRDNPRASSPVRASQQDNPRTSCAQRDNPRASSPNRTTQQDNPRTSCAQRDNPRASSPVRASQQDNPRTSCAQRDNPRTSSPNRTTQRDNPRTSCAQRDNPRTSSPNRTTRDNPRTSCAQRDNPRASSPNRASQQDNPRTSIQQNIPRSSSTQQDNPKTSCTKRDNLRPTRTQRDRTQSFSFQRDNPGTSSSQCCTQKENLRPSSPHRSTQWNNPRNSSPHRTNKDIPWASFPLRPTQSDGPRTSSPSRSKQNEVPWASIALRPTQGDRPQTSSPSRPAQHDPPQSSFGPTQYNLPSRVTSSSPNPGHQSTSRTSSPVYPAACGVPLTYPEPSQPPCAVCIGHRDAPRASSPPRYLQHDPFPFFPEPYAPESELPHHEPPYIPPAVCIGHRDAPQASSPPRHTQFDPFPFLPDTSDAEHQCQSPQHEPLQLPAPVCIGYRDAPRASSPPRQAPEPSLLFQDLPRASTESLVPSMDSLHEGPQIPTPVCIGHRDAPSFSSPPRQAPEPSLFFQDAPGTSMESLAPSTDSLHGSLVLIPQVCIGHRDAPRASSPPRHPPSDLAFLAPSPSPGSSRGSRGSAPPGETRHNLEREEYTVLADLPPPRRLAQRQPGTQAQHSSGGRTRSPGRAEVERLFGQERRKSEAAGAHRKSEAAGAFQAQDEGRSQRPSQGQSQLLRRQSSPAPSRQVTKRPAEQAELTWRSQAEPPHSRSPEKRPEGDRWLQGSPPPPRTSARTPERELQTQRPLESGQAGPRQPLGAWQSQEEPPGSQGPHRHLARSWSSQEGGLGAAKALEGAWGDPPGEYRESWGQPEAWEEAATHEPPRELGKRSPLTSPPENWGGPTESSQSRRPGTPTTVGWGAEGACPYSHGPERRPELDWRDLLGLLRAPGEGAWARLPRLDWEGLLELLQARLPRKDPAGHRDDLARASGPEMGPPGTKDVPEQESHSQPEGWAEATPVNGHSPAPRPQSPAQPPSPACTSTQWPKTKVTRGPATGTLAGLEQPGPLGSRSTAEGPSLPELQFQPEEPEESEPNRGQDPLTDQKQADSADKRPAEGKAGSPLKGRLVTSWRMPGDRPTLFNPFLLSLGVLRWQRPDLLNFKKGWMSILDEPGEPPSPSLTTTSTSQWKKHWFVLTDSSLKYYRDSTAEEADELDGEIDLRSCTDVTEYAVQRNYGFQIHTKDAVYTLSAMTSGIRRNWIEALRKTVRPTSAPDVTKLSDCNKENTLHNYGTQKGPLKAGEQRAGVEVISRGGPRKADGQRQALDYVELSPLTQAPPQRARTPARTPDRLAKQEELERDLAQRSEERRKWFEATDSRTPEVPAGEGLRRGLGAPLTEDQQNRLSEEIEKKWQELEKLPLRENKRVPLTALLNQSRGERRGPPSDSHEALEKEVQALRAQLEAWRLQGEAPQSAPRSQEDGHIPPGYISQEACERSLAEMESSHQQVMEELQRHHERELQRLQQEKEWLLAEETAATASAIEAMKKAYQEELSRELSKTRSLQQGPDGLRKQHQSDVEALKRELQVLSEQYSQKCLEIGALTRQAEEREHTLRRCQQEGQELLRHNQELHGRLSEEIDQLRGFIASQGMGNGCGRSNERSSCELEVLLRVKENELQYLKKEVQCLRDELQMMQKDKRFTSGKYQDVYVELSHIKTRSEREIEQLKEHLRLAMAALQEKESMRNSLAE